MSEIKPEQIGDPSTFFLTDDGRVIFGEGPIPVGTLVKAMELGLRITVQSVMGQKVTFWAPKEERRIG